MRYATDSREIEIGPGDGPGVLVLVARLADMLEDGDISLSGAERGFRLAADGVDEIMHDLQSAQYNGIEALELFLRGAVDGDERARSILSVRLSKRDHGWSVTVWGQDADPAALAERIDRATRHAIAFGGEAVVPGLGGNGAADGAGAADDAEPRRVDREHDPEEWKAYAITRRDLAALLDRVVEIVEAEDSKTKTSINVPGFERSFTSSAEFLHNIDEAAWLQLEGTYSAVSGTIHCSGGRRNGLNIGLRFGHFDVSLRVSGANRAERNGVLPDLTEAAGQYKRPQPFPRWRKTLGVAPYALLGFLGGGAAVVGFLLFGFWGWIVLIASPLALMLAFPGFESFAAMLDNASPNVEFLPEDGISRWDRLLRGLRSRVLTTATLIGVPAAIVGILAAFHVFD
ncbi:MAG TPA: hypothetical protein VL988_02200 [Solirubrobacteraceae bacterium]|nr:hypothetical protein [Solirubrobacteraceae bacterium]